MQKHRSIGFIILTGFLAVILILAFKTKPYPVDAVQAHYAPMKVISEEEGKTRVVDRHVITAPIDAFMQRITLNEGESVKNGQKLLTLEPLPSSILDPRSRAQSAASLGAAEEMEKIIKEISEASKADKDLAEITFQRTTELFADKVVAQHEMDIVKAEKRRAEAVFRASQFAWVFTQYLTQMSRSALDYEDMRQTGEDLRSFQINSTVTGTILTLSDKSERVVRMGDVLMEIGDLSRLEIEAEVLSTVAVKLKPGMPVEIVRWGGDELIMGAIRRIEPSGFTKISALGVEEQRVKVIIELQNGQVENMGIYDGFRVETRFVLWETERVLQIPNSAIFRAKKTSLDKSDQQQWYVYVIKQNRLEKRAIQIGHRNQLMAEVISGIKENELLVSYLTNNLVDGLDIQINHREH